MRGASPPVFDAALVRRQVRAFGRAHDRQTYLRTFKLYAPYHPAGPHPGVRIARDIAYGPDERNLLDLFLPAGGGRDLPVLIYIPGGAFVRGQRQLPALPFFDNIVLWAAQHGMAGVNMIHRLGPAHRWPACNEDMARLVGWIRANAAAHRLDARRIYAMGPSSGAAIIANYIAHEQFHADGGPGIAAAILISGAYDPHTTEYYGEDRERWPAMSALPKFFDVKLPVLVTTAENDPPPRDEQAMKMIHGLMRRDGRFPWYQRLWGHNHVSAMLHIGLEPGDQLGDLILDFLATEAQ